MRALAKKSAKTYPLDARHRNVAHMLRYRYACASAFVFSVSIRWRIVKAEHALVVGLRLRRRDLSIRLSCACGANETESTERRGQILSECSNTKALAPMRTAQSVQRLRGINANAPAALTSTNNHIVAFDDAVVNFFARFAFAHVCAHYIGVLIIKPTRKCACMWPVFHLACATLALARMTVGSRVREQKQHTSRLECSSYTKSAARLARFRAPRIS